MRVNEMTSDEFVTLSSAIHYYNRHLRDICSNPLYREGFREACEKRLLLSETILDQIRSDWTEKVTA